MSEHRVVGTMGCRHIGVSKYRVVGILVYDYLPYHEQAEVCLVVQGSQGYIRSYSWECSKMAEQQLLNFQLDLKSRNPSSHLVHRLHNIVADKMSLEYR